MSSFYLNHNHSGIQSCLQEFLTVYEEAVQRLKNPSFRIATLGTTSSGKLTIVNALIGRRIAPIEAEGTSWGVLTLRQNQSVHHPSSLKQPPES